MRRTAASFTYPAHALVLRARPLGEKDRILTLFCSEKGRISAVAKGSRNPKSKLSGLAQPFVLARFLLAKGRSIDIVSQAQIESAHQNLIGDLFKTAWASFACELADHIPEGLPDERGFEILRVFLNSLDQINGDSATEAAGIWFETQWLAHQGHTPTIGFCALCERKMNFPANSQDEKIAYSFELGGTICTDCAPSARRHELFSISTLRALHRLERSRAVPLSLSDAPFLLDARKIGELGRCVRGTLLSHLNERFRSLQILEELRGSKRLDTLHN
jgi:DNA repair protein RecO (recombination protein O)